MRFRLVDIRCSSKIVQFIFSNEGTFQLLVETSNKDAHIFQHYKLYDIHVSHEIPQHELNSHLVRENKKKTTIFSQLGVVIKRTRQSVHIRSGKTHWIFPKVVCSLKSGIDVWITVNTLHEPSIISS